MSGPQRDVRHRATVATSEVVALPNSVETSPHLGCALGRRHRRRIARQQVSQLGTLDGLRVQHRRLAFEHVAVRDVAAFEPLSVQPVVVAGVIMRQHESHFAVAIHFRAARRVAHWAVEKVHAIEKHAHVGQRPQSVVCVEFDNECLIGRQHPIHVRGGATALRIRGGRVDRRKSVWVLAVDPAVREGEFGPVGHQPGDEVPGPVHRGNHRF